MNFRKLIRYLSRSRNKLFYGTFALLCLVGHDRLVEHIDEEDLQRGEKKSNKQSKLDSSKVLVEAAKKEKHGASTTRGILGK